MESIVIWGAGGHARVVAQTLQRLRSFEILGFLDELEPQRAGESFHGATVLGGAELLPALSERGVRSLALGFGHNAARLERGSALLAQGFDFPVLIDPHALVADDVVVGPGTYIAAGAIVQPGARIGAQVIVNTGAIVDHDARIGDGAHIGPRACLCGHAVIGRGAWIGAGSVIRDKAQVGAGAFVGIGSLVLADIAEGMLAYGHPARDIRSVTP